MVDFWETALDRSKDNLREVYTRVCVRKIDSWDSRGRRNGRGDDFKLTLEISLNFESCPFAYHLREYYLEVAGLN